MWPRRNVEELFSTIDDDDLLDNLISKHKHINRVTYRLGTPVLDRILRMAIRIQKLRVKFPRVIVVDSDLRIYADLSFLLYSLNVATTFYTKVERINDLLRACDLYLREGFVTNKGNS